MIKSRTLHECVDWNSAERLPYSHLAGRTLHECVDWNIPFPPVFVLWHRSHSTRVRGLKFLSASHLLTYSLSHSTRVRGLKLSSRIAAILPSSVALYTSAWIEISLSVLNVLKSACRTLHECVDWNLPAFRCFLQYFSVALYTSAWIEIVTYTRCPSLLSVALYTSAWIEIPGDVITMTPSSRSHSTRVRGLKSLSCLWDNNIT